MDAHTREHLHESPWVVTVPLVLLADPVGDRRLAHDRAAALRWLVRRRDRGAARSTTCSGTCARNSTGPRPSCCTASRRPAVWLAAAGVAAAWFVYLKRPELAAQLRERAGGLYTLLVNKYYFDAFNEKVAGRGGARDRARRCGAAATWRVIDGAAVNGSARLVGWAAGQAPGLQSGFLYHYAFATIIGLSALLAWLLWRTLTHAR